MTTAESIGYAPTRAEAQLIAASKTAEIRMDRSDVAALLRTLATLDERRTRAERAILRMGEDIAALRDMMEMLRLQIA